MRAKKLNSTKNSENKINKDNHSKLSQNNKNSEYFGQTEKNDEDLRLFEGNIDNVVLNSTNEKYNSKKFCPENVSTKSRTDKLISLATKNLLEKTYNSKEKGEQKEFLGIKVKRKESKKRNHKKRREKSMNKDGKKTSFIENQDNSLKSAMKAPFFLFVLLINQLGNITLENINLKKLLGGVKKNKLIFDLKLYQMLCIDDKGKNKEIIQNANPEDEILYKYFLTRTYRFLFDKYMNCNNIFYVNKTFRCIDSFPTFDKVLKHRIKRYYNIYDDITLNKKIEEFINASLIAEKNFEDCVEREPQNEKFFFIFKYPKIKGLDDSYNNIFENSYSYEPKFKLNIDYIKLKDHIINNLKNEKNPKIVCPNINIFEDFNFEKKEQKIKQKNNIINIGDFQYQNNINFFPIKEKENFNGNSFIRNNRELDNEIYKDYNQYFSNHELSPISIFPEKEINSDQNLNINFDMAFNSYERNLFDFPQKNEFNFLLKNKYLRSICHINPD